MRPVAGRSSPASRDSVTRSASSSLGVRARRLAGRRDADQAHERVAAAVHRPEHRARDFAKSRSGAAQTSATRPGPVERDRLRRELADHDVQERDGGEREDQRDGVHGCVALEAEPRHARLEEPRERGLAEEAEPDARERDAELGGGDRVVEAHDRLRRWRRRRGGARCSQIFTWERRTATSENSVATK